MPPPSLAGVKHPVPPPPLSQLLRSSSEEEVAYREFVAFARSKATQESKALQPAALRKQLDALQESLDKDDSRAKASKELQVLREEVPFAYFGRCPQGALASCGRCSARCSSTRLSTSSAPRRRASSSP